MNGRNLTTFKHNAGMKIVLVAKANHLVSEAMVFLQQDEFFRAQIIGEDLPFFGKRMPGMQRQQHFLGKQGFGFKSVVPDGQADNA